MLTELEEKTLKWQSGRDAGENLTLQIERRQT
jgi:hypothetical protein